MDIFQAINLKKWDLIILHPPCTYTAHCRGQGKQNLENAALSIINAHDQRKPQKQILKTLQDMVTDNPNWSDLTEETKKDILNFNLE